MCLKEQNNCTNVPNITPTKNLPGHPLVGDYFLHLQKCALCAWTVVIIMANRREIRNSTAEFLIFQIEGKKQGVEVYYKDNTVWCTQKAMGMLFDCSTDNIGLHLKNIFASGELKKESVTEEISATDSDGKNYMMQFYSLDAVISVGYRVNIIRATQFR